MGMKAEQQTGSNTLSVVWTGLAILNLAAHHLGWGFGSPELAMGCIALAMIHQEGYRTRSFIAEQVTR